MLRSMLLAAGVGLAVVVAAAGCSGANVDAVKAEGEVAAPESFDHRAFDALLEEYVNNEGLVDYARLAENQDEALTPYLRQLAETDPKNLSEDERLAFWLNAYNALALKLIADEYPVEGIRKIKPSGLPFIPKVNSPFKIEVSEVGGKIRTLDGIEHGIIREEFDEPRIHFALVCAAMSCPRLRREAYTGVALSGQLDDQARTFLRIEGKNNVPAGAGRAEVSKIFDWFEGDFGGSKAAVQRFIAPYFEGEVRQTLENAGYDVSYTNYNWALNDQAAASAPSAAAE